MTLMTVMEAFKLTTATVKFTNRQPSAAWIFIYRRKPHLHHATRPIAVTCPPTTRTMSRNLCHVRRRGRPNAVQVSNTCTMRDIVYCLVIILLLVSHSGRVSATMATRTTTTGLRILLSLCSKPVHNQQERTTRNFLAVRQQRQEHQQQCYCSDSSSSSWYLPGEQPQTCYSTSATQLKTNEEQPMDAPAATTRIDIERSGGGDQSTAQMEEQPKAVEHGRRRWKRALRQVFRRVRRSQPHQQRQDELKPQDENRTNTNKRRRDGIILVENVMAIQAGGGQPQGRTSSDLAPPLPPAGITTSLSSPSSPYHYSHPQRRSPPPPQGWVDPPPPPHPPKQLPLRFLRAGKGDVAEGVRRYQSTLAWRRDNGIDTILREPNPYFAIIKRNYPHYYHGRGYHGEPCFYEQPAKTNLQAILRDGNLQLSHLLRHYIMVTEFQWQYLVGHDDLKQSIYIIDLDGMRFRDFVGDVVDYVKKASALSAEHYPERAGVVFVINVPAWFQMIWRIVKPWIDEATLQKIFILRNKDEIRRCLQDKIPPHQLPREYGGQSPYPLGYSPEERELARLMAHNNRLAAGDYSCGGAGPCPFCTWAPPRSY